ncbi:MAG: GTP diphosphokinase [Oceanospirillaceae bacterium]|jgi:GTP pyrophosphokinase|uniref:GTP diphosphokinase n=1 Tax=unclassified Thalassolituus TaxID=2624967 RepID=UPI000B6DD9C1|nr:MULTISPECIES: GTP diphosphokinase [unclassified Thalassolituus]MAE34094.1 GTP diphosphokinase [Oceanospirillaceae bacterium]OUX65280.1 MAG: GTP diphosphokinase [Oceanospirillaceae bacterium TMED276]MBN57125.1 GTP diphosphokinase [Oceanospirillaceae bacterium]MDQ4423097.1 GTP diphosphokinase [Thalassolituus sp.]MDQ4425217.1 GTP diphosphokinase [Thalassolituus sp.]|tara:strand:- start:1306 stop:3549 length:2244 start_codon:yes stop_codon:yes gene_type:complete
MVKVREDHPLLHDGSLDIDRWLEEISHTSDLHNPEELRDALELAKKLSDEAIANRTYWSIDSVQMGIEMAQTLIDLRLDNASIIAAILYRAVREGRLALQKVERQFGEEVAKLIEGVLRMAAISAIQNSSDEVVLGQRQAQVDNLRKMLVAMIDDVRVALIKLAERTSAIRAVKDAPEEKRRKVAEEVFNIYAPLAHRLGIGHLKWELEDLSFRYLQPDAYKKIASLIDEKRLARQDYIDNVVQTLRDELNAADIHCDVYGRAKHIYSIWRKMSRKNLDFSKIYDIRAVRILVPELRDCYATLGIVHSLWRHIPNEFDDYIANPKENGYRSLHTAVIGPDGKVLEVQIRTNAMHEDAELGVCAHWLYKGTDINAKDQGYEQKIAWLRQVLEWQEDLDDLPRFFGELRSDINPDRIYVFTPEGHVVDLPTEATPVDFAYRVHTEVGNKCRGAKVDGRIVPLTYRLNTGEQVEILTHPAAHPSRDWLYPDSGYIHTARARAKVAHWFKLQDRDKNIEEGRQLVLHEMDRLDLVDEPLHDVARQLNMKAVEDMFAAVGAGDLRLGQIIHQLLKQADTNTHRQQELPLLRRHEASKSDAADDVFIEGVGNLMTQMAQCCHPVPGDDIRGYVTIGRGVTVHRSDCENLLHLAAMESRRVLQVSWGRRPGKLYPVEMVISAYDRTGLLSDVSALLANEKVNVVAVNTRSDQGDNTASMSLTVEVDSLERLARVMNRIEQLPNVVKTRRVRAGG